MSNIVSKIIQDIHSTNELLNRFHVLWDENDVSTLNGGQKTTLISFSGKNDSHSVVYDKHISGYKMIDHLVKNRQFNVMFYDRGMIQAEFTIQNNQIIKERFVFMKKIGKLYTIDEIEQFEVTNDDWYEENIGFPVVFRMDYSPEEYVECVHSNMHLTLSNYEQCRIPVKGAISYSEFVNFVVRHFYGYEEINFPVLRFENSEKLSHKEKQMLHINWND